MRLTFKLPLLTTLLFITFGVSAQSASAPKPSRLPEPLLQAVKKAVATNPDVQNKWHTFLSTDSQRDITRAGLMPQIDVAASVGTDTRVTSTSPSASLGYRSADVTLTQVLFEGFYTVNEMRRLGAVKLASYYDLVGTAESVALEAIKAYADVVRYRELVDLATQNYIEHKQSTLLVEERANSGVGRRVDVEQANGRLALAESNLLTELTNLHDVSARYLRIVGEKPQATAPLLPEPFRMAALPDSVESLMRDGLQHSPVLLSAIHNARAGRLSTLTNKAAYSPRIVGQLFGSKGTNTGGVSGESDARGGTVALNYNVFKGGADRANDKATGSFAAQAVDQQNKACRDVRQTLSKAFSDIRTLAEQMEYEDRHRLASEKTREAYRQQFEIGQRTLMDLLDTQNEYFQASRTYINARHDQAAAQARTLSGMGKLMKTLGVDRPDMPTAQDAGEDDEAKEISKFCEGTETVVDTVENIKAGLNLAKPVVQPGSYVVLLPDLDNKVGQVTIEGKGGKQTLQDAQKGAAIDGGGASFAVNAETIKRDFGNVIAALPKAPERFVLYFVRGANVLANESKALLPKIVERAALRPGLDMSVIGHTDTSGSVKVNEALGRSRAAFVTQQLKDLGLKTDALILESLGQRSLEISTPDNTVEQRNRRVEVILR